MKTISKEQGNKQMAGAVLMCGVLGTIFIIGLVSVWLTQASSEDEARLRRISKAVHTEACDITAKGATWTVASMDTASLGDVYVVKLRITNGTKTIKLNRHRWQTHLDWSDLAIGSPVSLKCNGRLTSVNLSDHLIVSRQTL